MACVDLSRLNSGFACANNILWWILPVCCCDWPQVQTSSHPVLLINSTPHSSTGKRLNVLNLHHWFRVITPYWLFPVQPLHYLCSSLNPVSASPYAKGQAELIKSVWLVNVLMVWVFAHENTSLMSSLSINSISCSPELILYVLKRKKYERLSRADHCSYTTCACIFSTSSLDVLVVPSAFCIYLSHLSLYSENWMWCSNSRLFLETIAKMLAWCSAL